MRKILTKTGFFTVASLLVGALWVYATNDGFSVFSRNDLGGRVLGLHDRADSSKVASARSGETVAFYQEPGPAADEQTPTEEERFLTLFRKTLFSRILSATGEEKFISDDIELNPDEKLRIRPGAVNSGKIARHGIEQENLDTGSVTSRVIRNQTIRNRDIADDIDLKVNTLTASVGLTSPEIEARSLTVSEAIDPSYLRKGGVVFYDGKKLSQSPQKFFWDEENSRLGLGTDTPTAKLSIRGRDGEPELTVAGSSGVYDFVVDADGEVGIGMGSYMPTIPLMVSSRGEWHAASFSDSRLGNFAKGGIVSIGRATGGTSYTLLYLRGADNESPTSAINVVDENDGQMFFLRTAGNSVAGDSRMFLRGKFGIGTTDFREALNVAGAIYLPAATAPGNTANKLYAQGGDLYWAGNVIGGSAVGTWTTDGTDVWRPSGNVGVGTAIP
ncbi:MAG TPA: hypothetical protein ENJ77_00330, partial [Candidatus Moranbacteria bacterium]|nr:hypothetical protein [Candidatus Moranbacteria bacterium]